jgi:hypothetical protein
MMSLRSSFASSIMTLPALALFTGSLYLENCSSQAMAQAADETPKDMIASQVRRQGFACDNPQGATKDQAISRPDEAAWVLACENATYRVRLIPHKAAKIEQLQAQKQK